MATATELMHIATLVHDNAIDSADTRRGHATINSIWGLDLAILVGDFLFARAGEMSARTGSLRVVTLFSQTLGIIARGEVKQALSAFRLDQTSSSTSSAWPPKRRRSLRWPPRAALSSAARPKPLSGSCMIMATTWV